MCPWQPEFRRSSALSWRRAGVMNAYAKRAHPLESDLRRVRLNHEVCHRRRGDDRERSRGAELVVRNRDGDSRTTFGNGRFEFGILGIENRNARFGVDCASAENRQVGTDFAHIADGRAPSAAPTRGLMRPPITKTSIPGRPMRAAAMSGALVTTVRPRPGDRARATARLVDPASRNSTWPGRRIEPTRRAMALPRAILRSGISTSRSAKVPEAGDRGSAPP